MKRAVEMCSDLPIQFEIEHRPYRLHPVIKDGELVGRRQLYESKLGKDKMEQMEKAVAQQASELGITIKFLEGTVTQTTLAHRLLRKAWKSGGHETQQALVTALFKAHFEDLANIGDKNVLADMAVTVRLMSKAEALDFLESDECLDDVEGMITEARQKGVTSVPFVVIEGKWAVSGGQRAEAYLQIFKKLANGIAPGSTGTVPQVTGISVKA